MTILVVRLLTVQPSGFCPQALLIATHGQQVVLLGWRVLPSVEVQSVYFSVSVLVTLLFFILILTEYKILIAIFIYFFFVSLDNILNFHCNLFFITIDQLPKISNVLHIMIIIVKKKKKKKKKKRSKVGNLSRGWLEGSLFNSYYTKV